MDFQSKKEFHTFDDQIPIFYHNLEPISGHNRQVEDHEHVEQKLIVLELPVQKQVID